MNRQFRAIAIVVALAAIAVVVISHRHDARSSAPATCRTCRHGSGGPRKRALVITSPKVIGGPLAAGNHVNVSLVQGDYGNLTVRRFQVGRNLRVLAVAGATVTLEVRPRQAAGLMYAMRLARMRRANARLILRRTTPNRSPGPPTLRV
jgi:hypothetical protein